MDGAVVLALIALLAAHVGDVAASCRKVPNDDMREYLCEGGHPGDLATVPETTEKLRINRMPLRRITADTFAKFGDNLWVLSCSHCEISEVETDAFRRLVNLQQLSLDNNYLTTVKASWFEGLDSLTYLDVNYNSIHDIEDGVYQNLPALVDFRVSGNRLRCLNLDGMSRLRQLKRMFLNENPEFACPHAVSEFLENQRVIFERDPEWKRIGHDAIEVHVPPARVEEEEEEAGNKISVPVHRERLHPDRRPPHQPEESIVPPATGDRRPPEASFYPAEHYGHRRRPMTTTTSTTMRPIVLQSHIPRVEPIPSSGGARTSYQAPEQPQSSRPAVFYPYPRLPLEDARMMLEADRLPLTEDDSMHPSHVPTHEITSVHPSYMTSERPWAPSVESRPSPEDIGIMAGTDRTPSTGYTLYPAHETTSAHPSYTTPEDSRVPLVESRLPSKASTESTARSDRPMTEHTLTYPQYEVTHETSYLYPYISSERPRVSVAESEAPSENEATWSDGSSRGTVIYPLYAATSDGWERTPHGSIQMTWPSSDPGASVTSRTLSTDDSIERHPDDSLQDAERHQQWPSSWSTTNTPMSRQETPYQILHKPIGSDYTSDNKVFIDNRWSSSTDDIFIATNLPVEHSEAERSRTSMMTSEDDKEDLHYIRPVPHPKMMHSISTDKFDPLTVRPLNYQGHDDEEPTTIVEMTTDKPLPDCPKRNSAPRVQPVFMLMSIVFIFGHIIIASF